MNCQLDFFSYQSVLPNFTVPLHRHNCFELVYYKEGSGEVILNGQKYIYHPHSFIIIFPDVEHSERSFESSEIIYFGFEYNSVPIPLTQNLYHDPDCKILNLILNMKEEIKEQLSHYNLNLNLLLSQIIIHTNRLIPTKKEQVESSFSYIIDFINENYYKDLNTYMLSKLSYLSYHRFRHLFKEITGFSPTQFIVYTRLKNAQHLLDTTSKSLTEISYACGFSTPSQFSTLFKKSYGITPSEYRTLL